MSPGGKGYDYSGDDLAGVLYFLAETANPMLDAVSGKVGAVIDGFEGFEFKSRPTASDSS